MASDRKNDLPTTNRPSSNHIVGKVARFLSGSIDNTAKDGHLLTLTCISGLLNTSPELVNESLVSLKELGVIRLEHMRVVIRDKERLQRIGVPD